MTIAEKVAHLKGLMEGLNCYDGKITFKGVAEAFDMECVAADTLL